MYSVVNILKGVICSTMYIIKILFRYDTDLGSYGLKICNYSWLPSWNKRILLIWAQKKMQDRMKQTLISLQDQEGRP